MTTPTPAELEILQILWELGESKIQEVNDKLNETRPVGYTTTLKLMQIMYQKGLVDRKKDGKSHIYLPLIHKENTETSLLNKFIESTFGGSRAKLMMRLIGRKDVSQAELDEIERYLDNWRRKDK